jgi:hypothetical protein
MGGCEVQHSSLRRGIGLVCGALVVLTVSLSPIIVSAHHGWGTYLTAEFEITGTAETPVSLAGPHAAMKLRVNGQVWDVMLAPGARTERAGLKDGMIPLGATVTAHGHRHQDPKRLEIKTERLTWNGRVYNVYPDRE